MTTRSQAATEASADIVRATTLGRAWTLTLVALVILLVVAFQWFVFPLIDTTLGTGVSPAPLSKLKLVFTACALAGVLPAIFMIATGWKIRRYGQFPSPDAWVWRDTPVKRGPAATRIAWLCMAAGIVAGVLCIGLTIYAWIMFDRLIPQHQLRPGVIILHETPAYKP